MIQKRLFIVIALFGFGMLAAPASAQESGGCGTTMYRYDNIGASTRDTLPSIGKQISWLGMAAKRSGCNMRVTCAQTSESEEDERQAARVCRSARNMLLTTWEHRGDDAYNDNLLKTVGLRYVAATESAPPGTVFIQLLP